MKSTDIKNLKKHIKIKLKINLMMRSEMKIMKNRIKKTKLITIKIIVIQIKKNLETEKNLVLLVMKV
jgi:hypothetical protein